jgi:hypothetical protein
VKTNILSTLCFLVFLTSGLLLAVSEGFVSGAVRRRLTNVFLLVVLFVSFGAGLTQHQLWPFSSWPVLAFPGPGSGKYSALPRIMGVDADGNEYDIDYRAWQPLELEELLSWIRLNVAGLDPAARDRVGAYLLGRANLAREQASSSAGVPYPNRWFGRLTAPTFMLHPAIWSRPGSVPHKSFTELRIYEERWNPDERSQDPRKVARVLVFDYRP